MYQQERQQELQLLGKKWILQETLCQMDANELQEVVRSLLR